MVQGLAAAFRRALLELDVPLARRLWRAVAPHLPQPASDAEALTTLHVARTKAESVPPALRAYSEAWLAERASGRVVHAVGIAVGMAADTNPVRVARAREVRGAMEHAVELALRDGVDLATETAEIKRRMMRARAKA